MPGRSDLTAEVVVIILNVCWLGFLGILIVGKRGAAKIESKREVKSFVGFFLQCIAYAICFTFHRTYFSPILAMSQTSEQIVATITIAMAVASVWLCCESARMLGRQWALAARVIEGHELITSGPYARVRNPIYLAMLGMLLATGCAFSRWPAVLVAVIVFIGGTRIRIGSEERLLREAFGARFENYARKVPTLFPRML